jgi:hypothetical protein
MTDSERMPDDTDPPGNDDAATIRIVLADDHRVVRRGLRILLEREPEFEVVAEGGDVSIAPRICAALVLKQVFSRSPAKLLLSRQPAAQRA